MKVMKLHDYSGLKSQIIIICVQNNFSISAVTKMLSLF